MKMIQLYMPEELLEELQHLVNAKIYPNRAEAIRLAIRDLILKHQSHARAERGR